MGSTALVAMPVQGSALNLTLTVDPASHTYKAYANVNDPNSAGLAGIQFDIIGAGGVLLSSTQDPTAPSLNDLPTGTISTASGSKSAGFYVLNGSSDVTPDVTLNGTLYTSDVQFAGAQSNTFLKGKTAGNSNVLVGFASPGVTSGNVGDQPVTFGSPALIAEGTYTGDVGTISISGSPSTTTLLPAVLPTVTNTSYATHSPDMVNGQIVPIGIPEPTTLGLLGVVASGLLTRRRRA